VPQVPAGEMPTQTEEEMSSGLGSDWFGQMVEGQKSFSGPELDMVFSLVNDNEDKS
jgi:hypothetical protein